MTSMICPTPGCGAPLPIAQQEGITVLHASFPADLAQIGLLAAGGAQVAYCPNCTRATPFDSVAVCVIHPARVALVYLPASLVARHPGIEPELQRLLAASTARLRGFVVEVIHDPVALRRRISRTMAALAIPLLNDFTTDALNAGPQRIGAWMKANGPKLDRSFFGAAYLLGTGGLALSLSASEGPGAADAARAADDDALTAADRLEGEAAREVVRDKTRQLLTFRLLHLAHTLIDQRRLGMLWEEVSSLLPPESIDAAAVEAFRAIAARMQDEKSLAGVVRYTYDAVLAAICVLGEIDNPREKVWAAQFVAGELARRRADGAESDGLTVSTDFAAITVDPRDLWDQLAVRMKDAREGDPALLAAFAEMAEALGFEEVWSEYVRERWFIDFSAVPDDELDEAANVFTTLARQTPGGLRAILRPVLASLAVRGVPHAHRFASSVFDESLAHGEWGTAIAAAAIFTELLNTRLFGPRALAWVRDCIDGLARANAWPPPDVGDHAALLTEEANALRQTGDLAGALGRYELIATLLPDDLSSRDVRVNERNRAIALRDTGNVDAAAIILDRLLPHAGGSERATLQHSRAICWLILGQPRLALDMTEDAVASLGGGSAAAGLPVALPLNLTLASLAFSAGQYALALEAANRANESASAQQNLWGKALALGAGSLAADGLAANEAEDGHDEDAEDEGENEAGDTAEDAAEDTAEETAEETARSLRDGAIQLLSAVLQVPESFQPSELVQMSLRHLLADRLEARGDLAGATRVLDEGIARYGQADIHQLWAHWVNLARLARRQGNTRLARTRLVEAQQAVVRVADKSVSGSDLVGLMTSKRHLQLLLADDFLDAVEEGSLAEADLRLVADFQASVLLSRRLAASLVAGPDASAAASDAALLGLLGDRTPELLIIQGFESSRGFHLLRTHVTASEVRTGRVLWTMTHEEMLDVLSGAWNRLARWSPARTDDPLDGFEGWREVAQVLRVSVEEAGVPPGTQICLIPGPLSGLPMQYALADAYPLCYAPSLSAACVLRARRRALDGPPAERPAANWRPRSMHDFVVWQTGEPEVNVEQFQRASDDLRDEAGRLGLPYQRSIGTGCTREALFDGLQRAECVRLSCHGRSRPAEGRFELLVADGTQLPPRDVRALESPLSERFFVDWKDLSAPATAPLVFSAACGSGLAVSVEGGERIGLERSLLRSGTHAYVAPQWPVPIASIQPLIHRIIRGYLGDASGTLAQIVRRETNAALAEGMPLRVARSVAVHGDWM